MKRNFQTLVVFNQFLIFGAMVVQSLTDDWMSPELRSSLGFDNSVIENTAEDMSPGQMMNILWWGLTLISLLASVGVVLFLRWGRILFVLTSILSLLLTPIEGLYVDVGWTVLIGSVAGITEGMIIALMFFSPVRRLFKSAG